MACAKAIIESGQDVTLLDAGYTLEPQREALKVRMAKQDPSNWSIDDIDAYRTKIDSNGNLSCKLASGSDYPYKSAEISPNLVNRGVGATRSYAQGGFSNVWGAALMPFRQDDMLNWPISAAELASAQKRALEIMPFAAQNDDLAHQFPLYASPTHYPRPSQQIRTLLSTMQANKSRLIKSGIYFGSSRVAAAFDGRNDGPSCNSCGFCMHGCPRDLVYSSIHTLKELLKTNKLNYIPGLIAQRFIEDGDVVRVFATDFVGKPRQFLGTRAFLAAGAINSSEILLRSLNLYDHTVELSDSQYYVFPLLQLKAAPNVVNERLNTLSQAFIEIFDKDISPYAVQIQMYGYNDILRDVLKHKLGSLYPFFPENIILGRFLLAQGYLHSEHSGKIALTLRKDGDKDTVTIEGLTRPETREHIDKVMRKLTQSAVAMRAIPVKPLLQVTDPGRGFHHGGSFPMSASPHKGQTDVLGRPYSFARMHVVDATILPSIPATTITQTVMANAYRIACETTKLFKEVA